MEKIIFFGLAIPILVYIFYLDDTDIISGFRAKASNRSEKNEDNENELNVNNKLSNELNKLNELFQSGVLTSEEFEKAKKKILGN